MLVTIWSLKILRLQLSLTLTPMKVLSLNFRGVGCEGFNQEVRELINLYQPNILFFTETKANSYKAKTLIKNFSFRYPLFLEASPISFMGGLLILCKNSPNFQLQSLDRQSRFVHGSIRNDYNNSVWLITFIHGYPHHLQKLLWDQIGPITDTIFKPWLILGDFNELSSSKEKISFSNGNSTRYNSFNYFIN